MKRKGKIPRFKKQRRLLMELPGLGKAGALERRPYPPGEHGLKRKKYSEYALQLEEKQKIRFHYNLNESQLRHFVHEARRTAKTHWVTQLISLLERRVDNLIFRLGFAPSIPAAQQLVSHGKVLVNGKKVDIKSAVLKVGDKISLKPVAYENQVYQMAKLAPRLPLPDYLMKDDVAGGGEVGRIIDNPHIGHVPFTFDDGLLTSYYSLKG